jgi:hypothetical protein
MNDFVAKLQAFAEHYQKRTTSFRTPEEIFPLLADGFVKLDLSPIEFQTAVCYLITAKANRDVNIKPEALLIALRDLLA